MIKYEKVLCDIMECTEHSQKGIKSSAKINEDVVFESFDGVCYYDGKAIQKRIPFVHITEPYNGVYIPESRFNFITSFLIGFKSKFHGGITIDNKRFYSSSPFKVGDIFVEKIETE